MGQQNKLGELVKTERERLGWNQSELARRGETQRQYIRSIETGEVDQPRDEVMQALARAFASSPDSHLSEAQWETQLYVARGVRATGEPLPRSATALDIELIIQRSSDPERMRQLLFDLGDEVLPTLEAIQASFQRANAASQRERPTARKARRSTKQDQHC